MIKRAILVGTGLGLTTLVLFGRNAASYVSTSYHRLTSTVQDPVPVDFQIDRAKQMVRDLDPEIRNSMHVIAKEEVAVEQLNQQITGNQDKADKEKKDILRLQADLGQNKSVYQYASHTYTCDEVKQDLARRFSRFKVADDTLASMKQMRDARQKNLDAAQQKLARHDQRPPQAGSRRPEPRSQAQARRSGPSLERLRLRRQPTGRAKELITDIRTRLDVAAKLANADVNVQTEIPLDEAAPPDITDQVTQYFKLDDKADKVVEERTCEGNRSHAGFARSRVSPTS